jgi:hypothetical protein
MARQEYDSVKGHKASNILELQLVLGEKGDAERAGVRAFNEHIDAHGGKVQYFSKVAHRRKFVTKTQ